MAGLSKTNTLFTTDAGWMDFPLKVDLSFYPGEESFYYDK
jgi:hypothetical protein